MQRQAYEKYCPNCGALINANATSCPKCHTIQPIENEIESKNSDWLVTFLLCFFLGTLGIHRFYNNKIGTGILMLLTIGGLGLWYIIDLILIISGKFTDRDGNYLKP